MHPDNISVDESYAEFELESLLNNTRAYLSCNLMLLKQLQMILLLICYYLENGGFMEVRAIESTSKRFPIMM